MKKALFGIIVLLIVIVGIVFVLTRPKEKTALVSQDIAVPTPVLAVKDAEGKSYTDSFFSIQYPADWTTEVRPLLGGGELVHFQLSASAAKTQYPSINISVLPGDDLSKIQNEQGTVLKSLGLEHQSVKIGIVPVEKYSGVITKPLQTGSKPTFLQQVTLLYPGNQMLFVITYRYEGDRPNDIYEGIFSHMIGSFTPKEKE